MLASVFITFGKARQQLSHSTSLIVASELLLHHYGMDTALPATASKLPIECIAEELEYLRDALPPAILTSCQSADAQLSKAQDQVRYVIVGGPPGSGKSTLIEAVTGALELLPSGGSAQSLTMVPTWLRAAVPAAVADVGSSASAATSSSSDRVFSLFIAHSVHNGSWDMLRRKTLERWRRSLESYEPIPADDAPAPDAVQVLLESQALDILKSVYPILSTSRDASDTTTDLSNLSKLFETFISLAPAQLTVPGQEKPGQAEIVVRSWIDQLNSDTSDTMKAMETADGTTDTSSAAAASSSLSPSLDTADQSLLAGITEIGTRREQVFEQLTAREVKFLLDVFAVDHREVVDVARLLILRAILRDPSIDLKVFRPIVHSLTHENNTAAALFRGRMRSDCDTARSLATHLRDTRQAQILLPVDILNMWPLVSRIEVRGRFELPPHVCLVDSAGSADEHQVVDPIQAVADGLYPSVPARVWYLQLGERCRAHTALLDPLIDLKRFGVSNLRLVLTKWDKVDENSSTATTRSDLAQHLATKLSVNAKQLESQIHPVSGMACKALREPTNNEFRKGITMDRYEASTMQAQDVDDLFGTLEVRHDAAQPSGVEQLIADVRQVELDVETDIRQQACVLVQEMFNALCAAQDMANLQVPEDLLAGEGETESDEVSGLDDDLQRHAGSQKASIDIYSMLRDHFEVKMVQVRSTLSGLAQLATIQQHIVKSKLFDDATSRDLVVARIRSDMEFLYHPKQLQVFLTSRGSFTACQRATTAKTGLSARTPKVFKFLEDLTSRYQYGVKTQLFWGHMQATVEQVITDASSRLQEAGLTAVDMRVKHIQKELLDIQQVHAVTTNAELRVKLYHLTLELQHIRHVNMQLQITGDSILHGFQHEFESMRIRHCNLQSVLQSDCMNLWLNMWEDVDTAVAKTSGKFKDRVAMACSKLTELLPPLLDKAFEHMLVLAVRAVVGAANASIHEWLARLQTALLRSVGEVQAFHLAVKNLFIPKILESMRRIHPLLQVSSISNDVQQALALAAQLDVQTKPTTAPVTGSKRSLDAPDTNPRPSNLSKLDAHHAERASSPAATYSTDAVPALFTASSNSTSDVAAGSAVPDIEPRMTITFQSAFHHVFFRGLVVTAPDESLYPVDDGAAATSSGGAVQLRSGLVRSSRQVVQDCNCATMSGLVIVEAALAAAAAAERQRIPISPSTLQSDVTQMEKIGERVRELMLPAARLTFEDVAARAQLDPHALVPSKSLAYLNVKHADRSNSMRDINQQIYSNGIGSFMKSVVAVCTEAKKDTAGAKLNIEAALTRDDRRNALTAKPHAAARFRLMRLEAHGWMLDPKHLISPQHLRANLLHLNPYVSLTDNLFHALRYAVGNKIYVHGDSSASAVEIPYGVFDGMVDYERGWQLPPTTDSHPHLLGVIIMLYVPVAEYDRLESRGVATNVQKRAANKQLSIAARVLPEREFSFFGFIPSAYLQGRWPIPLLQCERVDDDWKRFYNITDARQEEFKRVQKTVDALVKARGVNLPLAKLLQAVRKAFMACCVAKIKFDLQQRKEFDTVD